MRYECLRRAGLCLLPLCVLTTFGFGQKRAMVLDDLAKLVTVGGPQVSPDGKWIAYTTSTVDVGEDKNVSELWMVSWDGTQDIHLTYGPEGAGSPRWSPDGRWLAFTSSRPGKAKGSQVWLLDRRGGEAQQLTEVKEDLADYRWSPDSKQMLLTLKARMSRSRRRERSLHRRSRLLSTGITSSRIFRGICRTSETIFFCLMLRRRN